MFHAISVTNHVTYHMLVNGIIKKKGGVWCSGLCVGVWIRGAQVQTPLHVVVSPQIAPVGIAHSIEYGSRFG